MHAIDSSISQLFLTGIGLGKALVPIAIPNHQPHSPSWHYILDVIIFSASLVFIHDIRLLGLCCMIKHRF